VRALRRKSDHLAASELHRPCGALLAEEAPNRRPRDCAGKTISTGELGAILAMSPGFGPVCSFLSLGGKKQIHGPPELNNAAAIAAPQPIDDGEEERAPVAVVWYDFPILVMDYDASVKKRTPADRPGSPHAAPREVTKRRS